MFDRIEFLKEFNGFQPGDVSNKFTGGQADMLFRRGIARPFIQAAEPVAVARAAVATTSEPVVAAAPVAEKPSPARVQRRRA